MKTEAEKTRAETALEGVADFFREAIVQPTLPVLFGRTHLGEHQAARRIVFVTPGGIISPIAAAGGRMADDNGSRAVTCRLREERVNAHIYGAHLADAEALMDALIGALCSELDTDVRFGPYRYVTEEEGNNGRALRCHKVEFAMFLRLRVNEEVQPLKAPTGHSETTELSGPDEDP